MKVVVAVSVVLLLFSCHSEALTGVTDRCNTSCTDGGEEWPPEGFVEDVCSLVCSNDTAEVRRVD